MADTAQETRRFRVHARHVDPHHGRVLEETSFEAAAVSYLENYDGADGNGREISVIVRSLEDGRECCFTIDLDTGETASCD
jgi:hypothetical protein